MCVYGFCWACGFCFSLLSKKKGFQFEIISIHNASRNYDNQRIVYVVYYIRYIIYWIIFNGVLNVVFESYKQT